MSSIALIKPDRQRKLEKPFSWIPFRLVATGMFAEMSNAAKILYFFLCMVSDRRGLSFYGNETLVDRSGLSQEQVRIARNELITCDLLAYANGVYQVLSLNESLQVSSSTKLNTNRKYSPHLKSDPSVEMHLPMSAAEVKSNVRDFIERLKRKQ